MAQIHQIRFVIEAGQYTHWAHGPIDLRTRLPIRISLPSEWTPADIGFSGSTDGVQLNWLANAGNGTLRKVLAGANRSFDLPSSWFNGINWLYIFSGDPTIADGLINQAANRTMLLICKDRPETELVVESNTMVGVRL